MRKYFLPLFALTLSLCLTEVPVRADDSDQFKHITTAMQYWLRSTPLIKTEFIVDNSHEAYTNLSAIALHQIAHDPLGEWKVHAVADYDPYVGTQVPVTYGKVQMDRYERKENILLSGYYFFYRDNIQTGPRIVVRPTLEYLWDQLSESIYAVSRFYVYYSPSEQPAAQAFDGLMRSYAVEKNPYRASVLELGPTYQFKFLENVSQFDYKWDDLILEPKFKALTRDVTQDYLERLPTYRSLGIGTKSGVLLSGPPGTGKTLLGQILISAMYQGALKDKVTLMVVNARHLQYGSAVNTLFTEAGQIGATAIFMEDIDLFGIKNRDGKGSDNAKQEILLNELLNAIDGVKENDGLLVIGTTNQLQNVDSALLRSERIGLHLYFGLPTAEERKEFFERFGRKRAVWAADLTSEWLAGRCEGLSGADIVEIIGIAKRFAYLEKSWSGTDLLLTKDQFTRAITMVKNNTGNEPGKLQAGAVIRKRPRDYAEALRQLRDFESRLGH
jgi:AAA+ superfamily predicted ATPase